MFLKRSVESCFVYGESYFLGKFFGEFFGEPESVVKSESLLTADSVFLNVSGVFRGHKLVFAFNALYALIELFKPRGERRFELIRLFGYFRKYIIFLFDEQRIGFVVDFVYENFRYGSQGGRVEPQLSRVAYCAAKKSS